MRRTTTDASSQAAWERCLILVAALLLWPAIGGGLAAEPPLSGISGDVPWHIQADEVAYDQPKGHYIARGNVTVRQGDRTFKADRVLFDNKTMTIVAEGHVVATAGEDVLTGERVEIHLPTETGVILDGTLFMEQEHFRITAGRLEKIGEASYRAENASLTSCDGEVPDWKITGKSVKVTIEGYGVVTHAALWARNIPILYTPYLVVPVKRERQTGLLYPRLGYADRKGAEYGQPLFWAINDHSDATLYSHVMTKRGVRWGGEYRHILDEGTRGTLMIDFLSDRKTDDGTGRSANRWGYPADDAARPNTDRYWLRMKQDADLPWGVGGILDLDIVSDQDYLHEFQDAYAGFNDSEAAFYRSFGRGLGDYTDPVRVNRLRLRKTSDWYSVNTGLRWYDDVIQRRWGEGGDPTLQKLPYLRFDTVKRRIGETPFFWRADTAYVDFYREEGTRGHRLDLHPRIFWPLHYQEYVTVEPSLGFRETIWYLDDYDPVETQYDRTLSRELFDFQLDLFSRLYRIYHPPWEKVSGLRHIVRPRVVYSFIEEQRENAYPFFDEVDRVRQRNRVTYSVTSLLTARMKTPETPPASREPEEKGKPAGRPSGYRQVWRIKLAQSYDLEEPEAGDIYPEGVDVENRPFSPFYGEIRFAPGRFFSLQADGQWDVYEGDFLSRNLAVDLRDFRGDRLFAEHRYTRGLSETLYARISAPVKAGFSVYAEHERDMDRDRSLHTGMGVAYDGQCWAAGVRYSDEEGDQSYTFSVELKGLGGVNR